MAALNPYAMMKLLKIRMKVERGTMTMAEAEVKARPYMIRLNNKAAKNAKKKGETYQPISYEGFLWIQREIEKRDNTKGKKG
jgi:hypothetical protein